MNTTDLTTITAAELQAALDLRDLSDPAAGPHAMQLIVDEITTALRRGLAERGPGTPGPSGRHAGRQL